MLTKEFFYQLEDELTRARYEIDEAFHMASDAVLNLAILPNYPPPLPKSGKMTLADQIRAAKTQIQKAREGAANGVAAAVAETNSIAQLAAEEVAKIDAMNKELRDELAGLNGGEPL